MASSRPSYSKQSAPKIVSSGTVSRPKPTRVGRLSPQPPPTKVVRSHGVGG